MAEHDQLQAAPVNTTMWRDAEGRLSFSMSGPATPEQIELVQRVGEALGLEGYFDALCAWWRGKDNMPIDIPVLRAIVCAYEMGRAAPAQAAGDVRDAQRYRLLRRGQHWSVIDGIGEMLRAKQLDAAIDRTAKTGD